MTNPRIHIVKARPVPISPRAIRAPMLAATAIEPVAKRLPGPAWSLTLRLAGDEELRRLNLQFLAEDHVTDVLSFPAGDGGDYLGDIVISWAAAVRQAGEFGHDIETEVALLAVHGLLHLLDWDHRDVGEENVMNRLTVMALEKSGRRIAPGRLDRGDA